MTLNLTASLSAVLKLATVLMLAATISGCSESDQSSDDQATPQSEKEEQVSESKSFLEENKDKPGIIVTESGLQYRVLLEGTGKSPKATDTVTVHYEGTLTDGTKFDSSYDRGTPLSFPLNQVIRGWTEGLQLMKEGGKYKFFIPSELAYGPRGAGGVIGPNEDLIFTVELIRVN